MYQQRFKPIYTNRNDPPTLEDIYYSNWAFINKDLFDVAANWPAPIRTKWHRWHILCPMPPSSQLPSQSMSCAASEDHNEGAITSE